MSTNQSIKNPNVSTLGAVKKLIGADDEREEMLCRWQSEYGLLCFNINRG